MQFLVQAIIQYPEKKLPEGVAQAVFKYSNRNFLVRNSLSMTTELFVVRQGINNHPQRNFLHHASIFD